MNEMEKWIQRGLPHRDWILKSSIDLEELSGTCDYCGTSIRYEHTIHQPGYDERAVGVICLGKLTEEMQHRIAKWNEDGLKKTAGRKKRFLARFEHHFVRTMNGNLYSRKFKATVFNKSDSWRFVLDGDFSKQSFPTSSAALHALKYVLLEMYVG